MNLKVPKAVVQLFTILSVAMVLIVTFVRTLMGLPVASPGPGELTTAP